MARHEIPETRTEMRIPSPDEAALAAAGKLMAPALRAGVPIPACLLAIEILRLVAGAALAATFSAVAADGTQAILLAGGALVMVGSSLMVIPILWSEWRGWEAELVDYYRARARRLRAEGSAGRGVKLVLACALAIAIPLAAGVPGLPAATVPVGIGVASLLWIDVASVYAACVEPVR